MIYTEKIILSGDILEHYAYSQALFKDYKVIKKEKLTPKGTLIFNKDKKIGIEEQEQKGVIAPKIAAAKCAVNLLPFSTQILIFSIGI